MVIHRRSRGGCSQCRGVSRKCDEAKPTCGRCRRLQFDCRYAARFTWKDEGRKFEVETGAGSSAQGARAATAASASASPPGPSTDGQLGAPSPQRGYDGAAAIKTEASPSETQDIPLNDESLLNHFITVGHHGLHWSDVIEDDPVERITKHLYQTCPAMREAIIAYELLEIDAPVSMALSRVESALRLFNALIDGPEGSDKDIVLVTGYLTCHIGMKAGFMWTQQLKSLFSVIEANIVDSPSTTESAPEFDEDVDLLAGLDIDVWVVGKRTQSLGIWAKYCSGRQGVDPFTRLPRTLLDLLAQTPHTQDIEEKLQQWRLPDTLDKAHERATIWNAYRYAAVLTVHPVRPLQPAHLVAVWDLLMDAIRTYWTAYQGNRLLSNRTVLWPLFVAATFAHEKANRTVIDDIFSNFYPLREGFLKTNPRLLIHELWRRRDGGIACSPDDIAQEWDIELGIW